MGHHIVCNNYMFTCIAIMQQCIYHLNSRELYLLRMAMILTVILFIVAITFAAVATDCNRRGKYC